MIVKNIENLKNELDTIYNGKCYDLQAYLEDIKKDISENGKTGYTSYEINTKSGNYLITMYVNIVQPDLNVEEFDIIVEF